MAEKTLHAVYDDDDKLLDAVKKIKAALIRPEFCLVMFIVVFLNPKINIRN